MRFKIMLAALMLFFIGYLLVQGGDPSIKKIETKPALKFDTMVGKPAPDFTLTSYRGQSFVLSQLRGKKVVLFFNEGIMCYPACWNQIAALGTDNRLNNARVMTLSVVPDPKDGWTEAIQKMPDLGKENILLDSDRSVSRMYDTVDLPSSMHRGTMPGHTYILLDDKGIVRYTYDDPKMSIQNDMIVKEINKI